MKNKLPSQSKKDPWIPPPAKTTKSPKKAEQKNLFDPTYININFTDNALKYSRNDQLYSHDLTKLQMIEAEERLQALDITQKLSFEKSRQRLEELQEMMQNDGLQEISEFKLDRSPNKEDTIQAAVQKQNLTNTYDVKEQTQNLVYKLRDFEANSSMLRNILQDTKNDSIAEILSTHVDEVQKTSLLPKNRHQTKNLEEKDANDSIATQLSQKCELHDKKIEILQETVKSLQVENQKLVNMRKTQDTNRAHMQRELNRQVANFNRLKGQLKAPSTELFTRNQISQKEKEIELLKESFNAEKETWKRVLKLEKKKSAKNSEIIENLKSKISAEDSQIKEIQKECDNYKSEVESLAQIRTIAESELSILRERVGELETLIEKMGSNKLLNKNFSSDPANLCQNCGNDLLSVVKENHNDRTITKPKESMNGLNLSQDTTNFCKNEMTNQLNDQSQSIFKLTSQFEQQAKQIHSLSEKANCSSTEKLQFENTHRMEALNKKIQETEKKNFEISLQLAKCEEALKNTELRLNEKALLYTETNKKLENIISDSKHEIEILKEKLLNMEKQNHLHLSETQTQLSNKNMEIEQIKQTKKEIEETLGAKLSNLRNRLEHSQNTNRSLQNYVTFLKNSYATVFSDPALSTLSTPSKIN